MFRGEFKMVIQEILERYGFSRWDRAYVGESFYVRQEDVDVISDELKANGYGISSLDLINAGQETSKEYDKGVFLYTSRTGEYLESLIDTRAKSDREDTTDRFKKSIDNSELGWGGINQQLLYRDETGKLWKAKFEETDG
jgi:hypothetical protein